MSAISARPKTTVVKVMRGLSPDKELPATVYAKGPKYIQHIHLSPEAKKALGPDLAGYFKAEMLDGHWWLGARLEPGQWTW